MEPLERRTVLAKQVLCQLSYTPTAETSFDVKAFAAVRKLRKPIGALYVSALSQSRVLSSYSSLKGNPVLSKLLHSYG
jgi:hypothetical protein